MTNKKIYSYSVRDLEDGVVKKIDLCITNSIIGDEPLDKYKMAAIAWWEFIGNAEGIDPINLLSTVQLELHDLIVEHGDGVYMVHEGEDGPHDLVGYESGKNEYLIFSDLEHNEVRAIVLPI